MKLRATHTYVCSSSQRLNQTVQLILLHSHNVIHENVFTCFILISLIFYLLFFPKASNLANPVVNINENT